MSNSFSKEERVIFDELGAAFEDALVMSRLVDVINTDDVSMERSGDVQWYPQPYILQAYDGMDQTANFNGKTQLSVPVSLGYEKSVPWVLDAKEARDQMQSGRLGDAAKTEMASQVNRAVSSVAAAQGTLCVPVSTAAGDYDDIALCDSIMNEQGVPMGNRYIALSSRDYNGMAGNLSVASRSLNAEKSIRAYEDGYVGPVAGFETYKLDYSSRIGVAAGSSLTISTLDAAGNYHTPVAVRVASTGEKSNIDNRYQQVTISSTTGVVAGDRFTIAGVFAVNHQTKESTGQLKTFDVISVDSSTELTISPPIVSNQGDTEAEKQNQNVTITTKSGTSAIVFLNIAAANINPFWHKDALSLIPGRYKVESGNGAAVMTATTSNGITLSFEKQYDIKTKKTFYRMDSLFGVAMRQPEMAGILIFGQT